MDLPDNTVPGDFTHVLVYTVSAAWDMRVLRGGSTPPTQDANRHHRDDITISI